MVEPLDFTYYQNYLQAGLGNLETYLLSDQLFGHLGLASPVGRTYPNLTLGGLRGGISVVLALSLPMGAERDVILTITYAVVICSILVQGLTIKRVVTGG